MMDFRESDLSTKAFHVYPLLDRLEEHLLQEERYVPGTSSALVSHQTSPAPIHAALAAVGGGGSVDSGLSDEMLIQSMHDSHAATIQRAFRRYRLQLEQQQREKKNKKKNTKRRTPQQTVLDAFTNHSVASTTTTINNNVVEIQAGSSSETSPALHAVASRSSPGRGCPSSSLAPGSDGDDEHHLRLTRRCRTVQQRVHALIEAAVDTRGHVSGRWEGQGGAAHPWISWAPFW
jgi:hypothetical protein